MEKLNVWIQCRVLAESSRNLLDYQEEILTEMANDLSMHIIAINKEISNGKNLNTHAMKQLKNLIRKGKVDVILIYSKKRISIYEDIYEEFEMFCNKHQVAILTKEDLMKGFLFNQIEQMVK